MNVHVSSTRVTDRRPRQVVLVRGHTSEPWGLQLESQPVPVVGTAHDFSLEVMMERGARSVGLFGTPLSLARTLQIGREVAAFDGREDSSRD